MLQLTSKQWTRLLTIGAAAWLITACQPPAPTSEAAITGSAVNDDASQLLGAWHGELNGYEAYVHVVDGGRDGALRTLVIGHQDQGSGGTWGALRAIPAKLDGTGYLSIEIVEDQGSNVTDDIERGFHLVRYKTGPEKNYVTLYAMDETVVDAAIKNGEIMGDARRMRIHASSPELISFIGKHAGKDLFSVQIGYLERVTDDEMTKAEAGARQ